jgi:hypothetical protein
MVRVPHEIWEELARQARRERTAVAMVLRRLAAERLEQIKQETQGQQ